MTPAGLKKMTGYVKEHYRVLLGVGVGIAIGTGVATLAIHFINRNISSEIGRLAAKVESLKREVHELRTTVVLPEFEDSTDFIQLRRPDSQSYFSLSGGSSDEEEFLDTYEVGEEFGAGPESLTSEEYLSAEDLPSLDLSNVEDPQYIFQRVDNLLDSSDIHQEEAYRLLSSVESKFNTNPDFLWRLAKATYLTSQIAGARGNKEEKKTLLYASEKHASTALRLQEDNPNIHKWCAITLGSVGDYESPQIRIENGFKFKEHIERSIELCPTDSTSHYLLGRWCYEVSMLSWVERKAASMLFGTLPSSTIDEALQHFLEADRLQPGKWKENLLYIAKCYIQKRDYYTAVIWLDKAKAAVIIGQDGLDADAEVTKLLQTYNYYR